MRSSIILAVVSCLTLLFAVHPPRQGTARIRPPDTVIAPAADIPLDTPELLQSVDRINRKAVILKRQTEVIKRTSQEIDRETRRLQAIVSDSLPRSDTVAEIPATVDTAAEIPRHNLWRRFVGIFAKLK